MTELNFALVERDTLADALRGDRSAVGSAWHSLQMLPRLGNRQMVVIWLDQSIQPSAIVIEDSAREELFSWLATFHGDLTPISSWCQVLSPDEIVRPSPEGGLVPNLFGFEAAWASATLAEAMSLSGRSYDSLSLNVLLATETFAIGRAAGLYGARSVSIVGERLDRVRRQLRPTSEGRDPAGGLVREVLLGLMPDAPRVTSANARMLRDICGRFLGDRLPEEGRFLTSDDLGELLSMVPVLHPLTDLEAMSAEERVRFLRYLRSRIPPLTTPEWPLFAFGAGYVISRIGSAERDLRLADAFDAGRSSVLSWAMVAGSLGARTFWTDAFGGLGRFVARELIRPHYLLDPPTCDISYDEVRLFDEKSSRMRLRSANRNALAVSMLPGVTMHFGVGDLDRSMSRSPDIAQDAHQGLSGVPYVPDEQLEALAARLAPHLRHLFEVNQKTTSKNRKAGSSLRLPFQDK
ncbi:hypothetical protein SAMN05660859_0694 [Ancylobacter rudongensis]|uniref:Uncharacterized protein n=1 Tax=Ancylobacter rudongensis TaxID=177413 RepID=A0A1G4PPZ0_9HYPH|nr:hypothetical protein SAMN05660859_0694 [Ancylobacter rudongensis]